uniref:Uncharacterized protein n=1 Tax=Rhodopseudomonas palustris (strain BisA53) TaxID=316055 RepID=Q07VR3_RHOP5
MYPRPDDSGLFPLTMLPGKDQLILSAQLIPQSSPAEIDSTDRSVATLRRAEARDERVAGQPAADAAVAEQELAMSWRDTWRLRWSSLGSRVIDTLSRMLLPPCCS